MNISDAVARAAASLDDAMMAAGRVPAPGSTPQFIYDEADNSYRLTIQTIPREDCPHTTQGPISIVTEGVVSTVNYCLICKSVMA